MSGDPKSSRTFDAVAARLAANGYAPVPLHYGKKNPVPAGWQHYRFTVDDAFNHTGCGVGLLARDTPAADIDVRDANLQEQLQLLALEMLGPAPRRIGQPPKCLLVYRLDGEPFAKIKTRGYQLPGDKPGAKAHAVEFLADGQQFVAYNIHPDTGQPYNWNGIGDPLTVGVAELPPITREHAQAFIDAADKILAARGTPVGKLQEEDAKRPRRHNEALRADEPARLRRALAHIANDNLEYDDWIHIGLALKGALGDEGLADFEEWSAKSTKHDQDVTRLKWRSFEPDRIGAGSIYHWATAAGWRGDAVEPFSTDLVLDAGVFLALPLPEREPIIDGLLYTQSLAEIYGPRGCGKTWVALVAALSIAQGRKFLSWDIAKARRTLYVDGEMPGRDLQDRLRGLLGSEPAPKEFMLMPSEIFYRDTNGSLVISDPVQQRRFELMLDGLRAQGRSPEVIIFDNLSALTMGIEENSSTEFQGLKAWLTRLRHLGYTVIFIHHAGKGGDQRGTSGREDNLDLVMKLTPPDQPDDRTRMLLEFKKYRGKRPSPDRLDIELLTDPNGVLQLAVGVGSRKRNDPIDQKYYILKYIAHSSLITRTAVAREFDITPSTAKEHVQKLIKEKLVSGDRGPLAVTPEGHTKIARLWPEEEREM